MADYTDIDKLRAKIAADVAEAMREAIAAEYESGSEYAGEELSSYDRGIADAENVVARVRDAFRFFAGLDLPYQPEPGDIALARKAARHG